MTHRKPYTLAELRALLPAVAAELDRTEAEAGFEVRPLPPMTVAECMECFERLLGKPGPVAKILLH